MQASLIVATATANNINSKSSNNNYYNNNKKITVISNQGQAKLEIYTYTYIKI